MEAAGCVFLPAAGYREGLRSTTTLKAITGLLRAAAMITKLTT